MSAITNSDSPQRGRFEVYPPGSPRDARVDTMRGVFLMLMLVGHLGGWLEHAICWQPFGWVSAAEGFVLLSGTVFGYVQSRHLGSLGTMVKKSWKRAWQIYLWFMVVSAMYLLVPSPVDWAVAGLYEGDWVPDRTYVVRALSGEASWTVVWDRLLLLRGNVLRLYVFFLLAAPFLLVGLASKRWKWLVLVLSVGLWGLGFWVNVHEVLAQWLLGREVKVSGFPLFTWQLLFVVGIWSGLRWRSGEGVLPPWLRRREVLWAVLALGIFFFVYRHRFGWQMLVLFGFLLWLAKDYGWRRLPKLLQSLWFWNVLGAAVLVLLLMQLPLGYRLIELFGGGWVYEEQTRKLIHPMRLANSLTLAVLLKVAWERVPSHMGLDALAVLGRHSLEIFAIQAIVLTCWHQPWRAENYLQLGIGYQLLGQVVSLGFFIGLAYWLDARSKRKRSRV